MVIVAKVFDQWIDQHSDTDLVEALRIASDTLRFLFEVRIVDENGVVIEKIKNENAI